MTRRYERSKKASHLDTVYYEIDMMEYAHERLVKADARDLPESNMLIEVYLMHYRNLIEFFSGEKHRDPRPDDKTRDMSVKDAGVWGNRALTDEEQSNIAVPAAKLVASYFQDISQFLQHCTERRFLESRDWDVEEMHGEIGRIIAAFLSAFPKRVAPEYGAVPANSTGTISTTSTFTTHVLSSPKVSEK